MKISAAITELEKIKAVFGDLNIRISVQTGPDSYKWAVVKEFDVTNVRVLGTFVEVHHN